MPPQLTGTRCALAAFLAAESAPPEDLVVDEAAAFRRWGADVERWAGSTGCTAARLLTTCTPMTCSL